MSVSGIGPYDPQNVFARILRHELPCQPIYEDEYALAFPDLHPRAPVHVLIIPKLPYVSLSDFTAGATAEQIGGFFKAVGTVAKQLGLEQAGYRVLANMGGHGHQEVPHFHVHLFGGRPLGPMLVE